MNKETYQMTAKPLSLWPHVVGTKWRKKPLRLAFGAREGYEGGPHVVGTIMEADTPPTRVSREGGIRGGSGHHN
jgi:hypothetical protein